MVTDISVCSKGHQCPCGIPCVLHNVALQQNTVPRRTVQVTRQAALPEPSGYVHPSLHKPPRLLVRKWQRLSAEGQGHLPQRARSRSPCLCCSCSPRRHQRHLWWGSCPRRWWCGRCRSPCRFFFAEEEAALPQLAEEPQVQVRRRVSFRPPRRASGTCLSVHAASRNGRDGSGRRWGFCGTRRTSFASGAAQGANHSVWGV